MGMNNGIDGNEENDKKLRWNDVTSQRWKNENMEWKKWKSGDEEAGRKELLSFEREHKFTIHNDEDIMERWKRWQNEHDENGEK